MRTFVVILLALLAVPAQATRLKELVEVEGFRGNALTGVGVVVGLAGTGDDLGSTQTKRPLAAVMRHLGANIDPADIRARNVAVVLVTATLPPFGRQGSRVDVVVSSAGTARSLQGGTLVSCALRGADREVYALAQGPIAVGGFLAIGMSGSTSQRNHVTAGRIPGGALLERAAPSSMPTNEVTFALRDPDFTTAARIATAVNKSLGEGSARVRDPGAVVVFVRGDWKGRPVEMVASLEGLDAEPDSPARVIIDERAGTIAVGANVTLGPAAVAHAGITIKVQEQKAVSQPNALSAGTTQVVDQSQVEVDEEKGQMMAIPKATTVGDIAAALNALGVKPRDLVSILQALRAAGSLRAEVQTL